jgi:VRR-NUC domain/Fanconi anemia-associated nuclease SAP domain
MTESITPATPLAPDYYLHNFRFMVDWVWARYADLLTAQEAEFIQAFHQIDHDAQCLLVRLSSRKGPLFRADKLSYPEIASIASSAQVLMAQGLLWNDALITLQELTNILTKPELMQLFGEHLKGIKQARKEVLVDALAEKFNSPQTWAEWTNNQLGDAYYLHNQSIISTLLLLFFGNAHQDLTEFVLQDLGLFRYENYTIDPAHRTFNSREEINTYQLLIKLRDDVEAASHEDLIHIADQIPPPIAHEKLQRRRAKFCNHLAYELERLGEIEIAFKLYQQSHLPPSRERQIRLLEKQARYLEAWSLLNDLIETPLNEHELQIANRMAPRIAKKLGIPFNKQDAISINETIVDLPKLTDDQENALRVEEVVRQSLHSTDAPCVYAENALLLSLFGLWLWPEMFRSIDGAFANPFQSAPLDFYQENFAINRPQISQLWQLFENGDYAQAIRNTWQAKMGISNHLVHWSFLSYDLLDLALHSIPATDLKAIFERILFDIKMNRSGLPDLIQFFPAEKTYRLIEVKGPGDRLQDNQLRWLSYFAKHNIPAEVYYVRWK